MICLQMLYFGGRIWSRFLWEGCVSEGLGNLPNLSLVAPNLAQMRGNTIEEVTVKSPLSRGDLGVCP
jgi:hypothetical protein